MINSSSSLVFLWNGKKVRASVSAHALAQTHSHTHSWITSFLCATHTMHWIIYHHLKNLNLWPKFLRYCLLLFWLLSLPPSCCCCPLLHCSSCFSVVFVEVFKRILIRIYICYAHTHKRNGKNQPHTHTHTHAHKKWRLKTQTKLSKAHCAYFFLSSSLNLLLLLLYTYRKSLGAVIAAMYSQCHRPELATMAIRPTTIAGIV